MNYIQFIHTYIHIDEDAIYILTEWAVRKQLMWR